jgi:hypothetical protein
MRPISSRFSLLVAVGAARAALIERGYKCRVDPNCARITMTNAAAWRVSRTSSNPLPGRSTFAAVFLSLTICPPPPSHFAAAVGRSTSAAAIVARIVFDGRSLAYRALADQATPSRVRDLSLKC